MIHWMVQNSSFARILKKGEHHDVVLKFENMSSCRPFFSSRISFKTVIVPCKHDRSLGLREWMRMNRMNWNHQHHHKIWNDVLYHLVANVEKFSFLWICTFEIFFSSFSWTFLSSPFASTSTTSHNNTDKLVPTWFSLWFVKTMTQCNNLSAVYILNTW